MTSIQFRRRVIVAILLAVAVGGAVIRRFTDPASTSHTIGTLMLVMWVPVVGNIIAWLVQRLRRPAAVAPEPFDSAGEFQGQVMVELTLRPSQVPAENRPVAPGEYRCALVLGNEGFSARWVVPPGPGMQRGKAQTLPVQFLTPATALPRFSSGAVFRVLVGESFIADGRVLGLAGAAAAG